MQPGVAHSWRHTRTGMVNKLWPRYLFNDINTPHVTLKHVVGTSLTPVPVAITGNILKDSGNVLKSCEQTQVNRVCQDF